MTDPAGGQTTGVACLGVNRIDYSINTILCSIILQNRIGYNINTIQCNIILQHSVIEQLQERQRLQ